MKIRTALLAAACAAAAHAGTVHTFDDPAELADFTKDRYTPAVFEIAHFDGDSRLRHGVRAADNEANRGGTSYSSNFYNYQGMKHGADSTIRSVAIDLFVDSTWAVGTRAGFWTTMSNGNLSYPIIEYVVGGEVDGDSNYTGFRWWQSEIGWTAASASYGLDAWSTLEIHLVGDTVHFIVNGDTIGTVDARHADSIDNIILNVHNQGAAGDYDVYWDNLTFSVTAVPVPHAAGLGLLGLSALAARRRRA